MNHQQNENIKNIINNQNNYQLNNYDVVDELGNQINSLKVLVQSTSLDLEKDFNELENKLENLIKKK